MGDTHTLEIEVVFVPSRFISLVRHFTDGM